MLIGIAGKAQVGKDTTAIIIQGLNMSLDTDMIVNQIKTNQPLVGSGFEIRKFADKVKDITCLLIGCSRSDLEDQGFKETPLGKEWDKYVIYNYHIPTPYFIADSEEEANEILSKIHISRRGDYYTQIECMTPRRLMQLIGTECGRNVLHPQIWVNSLFAEYKMDYKHNWIISDVRFPNEANAIKDREGILIKINRDTGSFSDHISETALDEYENWGYVIDNNSSIVELIGKVREILIKEQIV